MVRGRMTIIDRIAAFHKDQSITNILSIVIWSHIHSCRQGGAGTMCHHLFIPLLEESRVAHDQTETRPRSRRSIEARPVRPSVRPSVGQLRARGRPGSRIYQGNLRRARCRTIIQTEVSKAQIAMEERASASGPGPSPSLRFKLNARSRSI